MYKVVNSFSDLEDGGFVYMAGDSFPRQGKEVTEKRLTELSTTQNKRGIALIVKSVSEEADKSSEEAEKPAEKKRKRRNAGADPENSKKLFHS